MTTTENKSVQGVYGPGASYWVGDGFPVRNLFPSTGVQSAVNPFLMLDYAGPATFSPSPQPRGVDQHPHRGFETVTLAYQGAVEHRDSAGNSGVIYPGDVQWMTAASGVVHEEKHERAFTQAGGTFEMVQLWVNLPKAHKMSAPRYQAISREQIPVVDLGNGSWARVIAGEWEGVKGPAQTFTPVSLFDLQLKTGGQATVSLQAGQNAAVVLLRGAITLNGSQTLEGEAQLAVLTTAGESVSVTAQADSLVLVLAGEPIREPIVSQGPFVMNTQAEIRQAMEDYRAGRMGRL